MDREAEILQQAEALLQAGQGQDAVPRLIALLKAHPQSEAAWLLLSRAVPEPQRQRDCLQQVLKINPANAEARARLGGASPASQPAVRASPFASLGPEDLAAIRPTPPPPPPVTPAASPSLWEAPRSDTAAPSQPPSFVSMPPAASPVMPAFPAATPPADTAGAQSPARPARPRKTPTLELVVGGLLLLSTLGCVIAGFFALRAYLVGQTPAPIVLPATAVRQPTFPPTWTPKPGGSAPVAPGATPLPGTAAATLTPSPTLTLPAPNATDQAAMDVIQAQVADLRGLSIEGSVPRYLISKYKLETTAKGLLISPDYQAQLKQTARIYSMLGLIKPTYDLTKYALNSQVDSIGGFYVPGTKELFVVEDETGQFGGLERYVFSHEFDHALTDEHFHFGQQGVYPDCLGDEQRCAAIRALVEGDATLLMDQWWHQYARPQDYVDLSNYKPPKQALPEDFPPPFAIRDADFPYQVGLDFVQALYDKGNWAEVNRAYANLPQSTAQIMHPDLYLAGQAPVAVPAPPLTDTLGDGWVLLNGNSLGEWMTYLILGYGADLSSEVDDATASKAADGWAGDSYQVYANDAISQTVLAAEWQWTTTDDAQEFKSAMQFYLNARWRGSATDAPGGGNCWEANDQATCLFSKEKSSLWLVAPNQTVLKSILAQYSDFP